VTHLPPVALASIACSIVAVVAAVCLMLLRGAEDQEIARRISALRQAASLPQTPASLFASAPLILLARLGKAMHARMLTSRDAEVLSKTLAASGLEPARAVPLFLGIKIASLVGVPALVFASAVVLGCPFGKQFLYAGLSLIVGVMLPNWIVALIRGPYQKALRRGIPDALDLMVVCAEAGLGLESTVKRVAEEMKQSNRAVGVEFSILSYEMRIMPDRRIALTNLAERSGQPALKRLSGTIAQTLKYGTPLGQALRTLSAEMRNERMIQFEERAGRLPALLVLPMILFILPCLFIVLMGQPVSQLIAGFSGAK
jgi:tight adherence protein C